MLKGLIAASYGFIVFFYTPSTIDQMPSVFDVLPPQSEDFIESIQSQTSRQLKKWLESNELSGGHKDNQILFAKYTYAKKASEEDPNSACKTFVGLARNHQFPLKQLSALRAHGICKVNDPDLQSIDTLTESVEYPWLEQIQLDILLKKAQDRQDPFDIMKFAFEKSKQALPASFKVHWTQVALDNARAIGNESMQNKLEDRLEWLAPRLSKKPAPKNFLTIAKDFRKARQFKKAILYYNKVINGKKFDFNKKKIAYSGLATTYKLMHDKQAYLDQLGSYSNHIYSLIKKSRKNSKALDQAYYDSQLKYVRALWTENQILKAQTELERTQNILKNRVSFAKSWWIRGRMAEEKGEFSAAIFWFEKALRDPHIAESLKDKVAWLLGWNHYKLKQYDKAIEVLSEAESFSESQFEKSRYSYWKAKSLLAKNEFQRANDTFSELAESDPLGYYGLLAKKEMGQDISIRNSFTKSLGPNTSPLNRSPLINTEYIEWLLAVEESAIAKDYLNYISQKLRKANEPSEDTWLNVFYYYAKSGQYLSLFTQLGQLPSERRKHFMQTYPELIFPRPHLTIAQNAGKQFNIDENLIYSIIRQESAFNPRARSFADAFGLMQLLPKVAKKTASRYGIPYTQPKDLYLPEINIPLGAAFLKGLLTKYDNQFILAVAAYNASERAIRGWLETRYRGDSLEFIEDIPYEETRSYVRLVMRNLIYYQALSHPENKVAFPSWPLKLTVADSGQFRSLPSEENTRN